MNGLRIYIEGGGDSSSQKKELRLGFQRFLEPLRELARDRRLGWKVILSGGRDSAYDDFRTALRQHSNSMNLLLVDAECPVSATPWVHLSTRDGWDRLGTNDDHCQLMVQAVESWLVADPGTLAEYYGQQFDRKALPGREDIEAVDKNEALSALERATQQTQKGKYRKIKHCAGLLARISVATVRKRAAHCDRLFRTVERVIENAA